MIGATGREREIKNMKINKKKTLNIIKMQSTWTKIQLCFIFCCYYFVFIYFGWLVVVSVILSSSSEQNFELKSGVGLHTKYK